MLRHLVVVSLCLGAFVACGTGAIQSNSPADGGVDNAEGGFVGVPADPNAAGDSTGNAASTGGAANSSSSSTGTGGVTSSSSSSTSTGGGSISSTSSSTGGTGAAGTAGTTGSSTGSSTGAGSTTGAPAAGLDGAGTLAGTVQSSKFTPQSATWVVVRKQVILTLWERANACAMLSLGLEPSGGSLSMTLTNQSGKSSADAVPGIYAIQAQNGKAGNTGQYASATYQDLDSKCENTLKSTAAARSGSVSLATVGGTYTGNFSLSFAGNDALTGSFDAVACPAASTSFKFSCQP